MDAAQLRQLPAAPAVSVVICAYTLDRWLDLERAVKSVLSQSHEPSEVVVVIDHNDELLERARTFFAGTDDARPPVRVVPNEGGRGLSGARNTGVAAATGEVVAFIDDDAEAEPDWIERLLVPYGDPLVVASGGTVEPAPLSPPPAWWPVEYDWVVGCSYPGQPTSPAIVRNLIGANMSARREAILEAGGFPEGIGRIGTHPIGCEETDLYIRLGRRSPVSRIWYEPAARVRHTVPPERMTWTYFRARCFAEGISKASVAGRVGSRDALASERTYSMKVLPIGVLRSVLDACSGERGALARAAAIVAGLALTTAGYVWGRTATLLRRTRVTIEG